MKTILILSFFTLAVSIVAQELAPESKKVELKAGDIIATKVNDKYVVSKILGLNNKVINFRFYKEEFTELPTITSTKNLTYLTVAHSTISRKRYAKKSYHKLGAEPLSAKELKAHEKAMEDLRKLEAKMKKLIDKHNSKTKKK